MTTIARPRTSMPRRRSVSLLVLGAMCASTLGWAQSIRIPDFRQSAPIGSIKPGEPCGACGRIVSIRETTVERKPVAIAGFQGAMRGPVEHNFVGAVVYLPLSESSADKPFIGGVGTPEMKERFGATTYVVLVRMDDGTMRSVQRSDAAQYGIGDRVRILPDGGLEIIVE